MNDRQAKDFDATKECNFAIGPQGIGRFRVSAFVQRADRLRAAPDQHEDSDARGARAAAHLQGGRAVQARPGDRGRWHRFGQVNDARGDGGLSQREDPRGHIVTIEDPVEYVHPHGAA
jgi:twitching motility protein PilU